MKRGQSYEDANANPNPYGASQMQHLSGPRTNQNSSLNKYSSRSESFPSDEDRNYSSAKAEGQWQWDRDAQQMSPHLYTDGKSGSSSRSFYPSQIPDAKLSANQESRVRPDEQDMEIGYEDNPIPPPSLEGLEKKFHDDIVKLTKEQADTEDAENARHREKIIDINNQYQERLSALRARHATRREEVLHKDSQARLKQLQLAGMNHYQNTSGPSDIVQSHQRQYGSGQFDSYRQHPESFGHGRMQGADTRVPTPGGGRVYNTGPRHY